MLSGRGDSRWSDIVTRIGGLVPTGIFDNAGVEHFLRDVFSRRGRSNDFRKLERPLYVIGVDLDSGEAVRFGDAGWDNVPISRAVQASAALPGLYPPVEIRGRHFVDGALRRTMHASVVLERDVDLMLGINPLVPFNPGTDEYADAQAHRFSDRRIAEGGFPGVISQALRTMLQSRMQVGLARYPPSTRTSTRSCSSPTPTTANCSTPTSSASPRAAASPSLPIATPWPTCASVAMNWSRCSRAMASACAPT
jgi:NTE family protein